MRVGKRSLRILLFLLFVLLLTSLVSPWVEALGRALQFRPGAPAFGKLFNRLFLILAITLSWFLRRWLGAASLSQLGFPPLPRGYRDLSSGFVLTALSMVALAAVMTLAGVFTPFWRLPLGAAVERVLTALVSAAGAGVLEELFFRGLVFKSLWEDWRPTVAYGAAALFFAALHFVKPAEEVAHSALDPWAGFRYLAQAFIPFLDPMTLLPSLFGLFLIGLVLSYAFARTNALYLSVGLHGGWVFGLKTLRVYGDFRREDLGWLFGAAEPKIVSGVAGWLGIAAVGVIVHFMTRRRERLKR